MSNTNPNGPKSTGLAYLLWWLLGSHYAYLGEWGKQILFWFTAGGLLLWGLADLFRMPGLVREANAKIANADIDRARRLERARIDERQNEPIGV